MIAFIDFLGVSWESGTSPDRLRVAGTGNVAAGSGVGGRLYSLFVGSVATESGVDRRLCFGGPIFV